MALGMVAGCSTRQNQAIGPTKLLPDAATSTAATPVMSAAGAQGGQVPFGQPVTLSVDKGSLSKITVTDGSGAAVPGSMSRGHTSWVSTDPIPAGTAWSWIAVPDSGPSIKGVTTSTPAAQMVRATANIGAGRVVGVAAPIIVNFGAKVINEAGVQNHLKVMIRPDGSTGAWKPAQGTWAWLPDNAPNSTAHFRTKVYWPANSEVRVALPLADLDWGNGTTGAQNLDWTFNIGRSQIVEANAKTHAIVIYRNGAKVVTYPASYGLDSQLNRNTRSGINIVTDKYQNIRMKSELFHYSLMEHWAVRINDNGEFIHANPETVQFQGKANVSHGCINLSTANAKAYFATAIYGDPVEVTGTRTKLSDSRTQLYDWALSWKQWTAMSAVH
ncbi:L,D-transpeptidase [Leekyejoonella antrihumi]|uniref:L,D-transpeptidase n=1 Tax=Leekyejoonella antrihumi TaxID=1660198 RepID=A0A563E3G1_9MICO|nr:Ig-like domain-containing protein [Leekyejoonella antrihumi]TWP36783.1 L,D-transpeptidase [Leekyejoonella antrihumi]